MKVTLVSDGTRVWIRKSTWPQMCALTTPVCYSFHIIPTIPRQKQPWTTSSTITTNSRNSSQDTSWRKTVFADILPELRFPTLTLRILPLAYNKGHWKKQPNETGGCVTIRVLLWTVIRVSTWVPSEGTPLSAVEAAAPTKDTWHCPLLDVFGSRAGISCSQLIPGRILTFSRFLFSLCPDCLTNLFLYFM